MKNITERHCNLKVRVFEWNGWAALMQAEITCKKYDNWFSSPGMRIQPDCLLNHRRTRTSLRRNWTIKIVRSYFRRFRRTVSLSLIARCIVRWWFVSTCRDILCPIWPMWSIVTCKDYQQWCALFVVFAVLRSVAYFCRMFRKNEPDQVNGHSSQ